MNARALAQFKYETLPLPMSSTLDAASAMFALRRFVSVPQLRMMRDAACGEEGQWFKEKLVALAALVKSMPHEYQNRAGDNAIVHLHYFKGGCDWYILERDSSEDQLQAFGYVDLGQGFPELGYVWIGEVIACHADLDLHWQPKTLREVKQARSID